MQEHARQSCQGSHSCDLQIRMQQPSTLATSVGRNYLEPNPLGTLLMRLATCVSHQTSVVFHGKRQP